MDINRLIQSQMMGTGQPMPAGAPPMQQDMTQDPKFQMAVEAFTDAYGKPPETDQEFAEVEAMMQAAMAPDPREEVMQKMTGGELPLRGGERMEPISDEEEDEMNRQTDDGMQANGDSVEPHTRDTAVGQYGNRMSNLSPQDMDEAIARIADGEDPDVVISEYED